MDGTCLCATGFEGATCRTSWAGKFVATDALVTDVVDSGRVAIYTYYVTIDSVSATSIDLHNCGGFGANNTVWFAVTATNQIAASHFTDARGQQ